jgi:hypothetical protein
MGNGVGSSRAANQHPTGGRTAGIKIINYRAIQPKEFQNLGWIRCVISIPSKSEILNVCVQERVVPETDGHSRLATGCRQTPTRIEIKLAAVRSSGSRGSGSRGIRVRRSRS